MILLSLVFCLACPAHGQQSMTLSECIRAAIDRNLDVKGQDLRVSKGTLAITQARARLLPQIGVTAAFNDNVADPVTVTGGTLLGKDFPDDMTWQKIRSTQYQSSSAIEAALPLIDLTRRAAIDVAKETATHLTARNYQGRTVGMIENGAWAPMAAKVMKKMLETSKNLTYTDTTVTVKCALNDASRAQIDALADELCK